MDPSLDDDYLRTPRTMKSATSSTLSPLSLHRYAEREKDDSHLQPLMFQDTPHRRPLSRIYLHYPAYEFIVFLADLLRDALKINHLFSRELLDEPQDHLDRIPVDYLVVVGGERPEELKLPLQDEEFVFFLIHRSTRLIGDVIVAAVDETYQLKPVGQKDGFMLSVNSSKDDAPCTIVPNDHTSVAVFHGCLNKASGLLHIGAPIGPPCFAYLELTCDVLPGSASWTSELSTSVPETRLKDQACREKDVQDEMDT